MRHARCSPPHTSHRPLRAPTRIHAGLFFLRADLRVIGLAFATCALGSVVATLCGLVLIHSDVHPRLRSDKNGKWDGLYAARDFPDSELSRAFGADWFLDASEPFSVADEGAGVESTLGPCPTTPLPPGRRFASSGERRVQPGAVPGSRSSAAAAAHSRSAAHSASIDVDDYTAGSKRKASVLLHDDGGDYSSSPLVPEELLCRLRISAPALIIAAQDASSTTVIAWPHPLPSFDGAPRRTGNREALSVLARCGMTPDQLSMPLPASDVAALQLQRARAGNAKAGTGAFPVIPIFSTGGHSHESVSESCIGFVRCGVRGMCF